MSQNVIKRAVKNTTGLDSELLEDIFTFFGVLAEFDEQLAARVVAYIVDGKEDDMLLLALAGNNGAAITLGYNVTTGTQNYQQMQALSNRRHRMLRGQRVAPASMWIRMAEVLDAIARAANCSSTFPPEWPSWLGSFMMETASAVRAFYANPHPWSLYALEKILIEAKLPPDFLVSLILGGPYDNYFVSSNWYAYSGNPNGGCYADLGAYCNRHLPAVQSFLQRANADIRISALGVLATGGFDFSPIPDLLVQIACGSSKVARETALPLLMTCPEVARPLLENTLAKGAAAERHEAVLVLWRLFGTDAIGTLVQHAEKETAERVKQTIEKLIAAPDEGAADCAELQRQLPPLNLKLGVLPLPAEAKTKIAQYFQRGNEAALRHYEQEKKQFESVDKPKWMTKPVQTQPVGKDQVDELVAFVEGTTDTVPVSDLSNIARFAGLLAGDWLTAPDIELLHIVRLSLALRNLQIAGQARTYFWWRERTILEAYRESCQNSFGLRELEAAVASLPLSPPGQVAEAYLANNNSWQSFCDWEPEAVWPLYAEQPEKLQEILMPVRTIGSNDYNLPTKRANAFKVLSLFPQVPCEFITLLWDIALGEGKLERIMAQKALEALPGKASKIIVALKDGKQNIRSAAAEWLGKIGDQAAIEPLKEAFQKEKNEIAKGTIMLALDALKANVDQFLNRDDLASEAKSGLSKKLPKGMEWVPLDNLPKLHWEDTGKQVDTTIVRWWVMQAIQQKTPACGPILRRYLSMCRKKDANGLSRFILSSWIGRDTTTSPPEEAAQRARKTTDQMWSMYGTQPYYMEAYKGDKENLYKVYYQNYSNELIYSAIEQKGMLSIAAAAGDADCVKLCEQYIRKYFGNRLSQCKSLIDVLAWLDHPLALQVLLSIANRFRTKALRQAAEDHVQAIAERQGWTIDELADRTIPDAGFERPLDEVGEPVGTEAVLELDYGPRQFEVRLNDELEPVITVKGENKPVKTPPAPGKNDDEEKAKAAKKVFSDAKKVVKEVVKRQTERLYEALCTQRSWKFDDWQRYLAQHPIVGRICTRVAWTACVEPVDGAEVKFLGCFRPLEDGSLTNENDEEANIPEDARVFVAHSCNVPTQMEEAWLKHFQDYDVTPVFAQFGRAGYNLPPEKKKEAEISDFEGHCLTTFKLRGKALKLGYVRGEAEDGGCFYEYRKPFVSLSMQAIVEFTGSYLPEEDVPAAITKLYFVTVRNDREQSSWVRSKMPLEKVPAVLLSECYNDIKQMAAEGSGFDPKWQEKSYF